MRLHDRVSGVFEVLVGVLSGGRIAATDVSADETFAQLYPALSGRKTFGTPVSRRFYVGICLFYVFAGRHCVLR